MSYRNPIPTVDIIIELRDRADRPILLIERKNPPYGWAIPAGLFHSRGKNWQRSPETPMGSRDRDHFF